MDPARWEQVQALFHNAAERTEPERTRFLEQACRQDPSLAAEVERMLEEDARTSLLDRDVTKVAAGVFGDALSASFHEFSPYRIKNVLGEGGMGVVYLAERKMDATSFSLWPSPSRR